MKHRVHSRAPSLLLALCLLLTLFPAPVSAAEGDVAQIGDTKYATLDEAIAAAEDGDTIELLADAQLTSKSSGGDFSSDTLTIDGNEYTIDAKKTHLYIGGNITFQNCTMNMYGVPTGNWMYIYMASNGVLTLDKVTLNIDGTDGNNETTAMYFPEGGDPRAIVNINNDSTVTIKNCDRNGISWGGWPNNGNNQLNITNSDVTIDNCAAQNSSGGGGIIGTFDITMQSSTLTVSNNKSYGSNGSNYYLKDSTLNYFNNGTHGVSATDLTLEEDSHVISSNNGYYGVYANGDFLVDSTSTMTVTGNSQAGDFAGLKLTRGVTDGKVEAGAMVTITGNYCSGLSNNGKVTFEEGAKLTIIGNYNDKGGSNSSYGGGVYNTVSQDSSATLTLPSDAEIYNNHALTGGDDIYNGSGATITFGSVGNNWWLNGTTTFNGKDWEDCGGKQHKIDGWYDDSADTRWEAHADTDAGEINHIVLFNSFSDETGLATVTGLTALKAAHGETTEEKVSLPSLDKSIVVTDGEGNQTGVDRDTVAAGDTVKFKLESNVPENLADIINYEDGSEDVPEPAPNSLGTAGKYDLVFHDVMAKELALNDGFFEAMLGDKAIDQQYYTITTSNLEDGCTFEVSVDLAAMYNADVIAEADLGVTPITVTYTATLSEEAAAGAYTNTAWVVYPDGKSVEDTVKVITYGIVIEKTDTNTQQPLSGAEFALYSADAMGANGELAEGAEPLKTGFITGTDGTVTINGLDEGTYYLVETKAPTNYVMSDEPLKIEVPGKADGNYQIHVTFYNTQVPETGGTGTWMYTLGGGAILMAAGGLFLFTRRAHRKPRHGR